MPEEGLSCLTMRGRAHQEEERLASSCSANERRLNSTPLPLPKKATILWTLVPLIDCLL